ncbi:MAG TPA: choice-of-anchor I family protein [Desulfobacterales bacterium]
MKKWFGIAATIAVTALLIVSLSTEVQAFQLQILHASDLEGGVEAVAPTSEDAFGRAPNFAAVVEALEADAAAAAIASVLISAGDNYIPGPIFEAGGDGSLRADYQFFYQDLFNEPGLTNIREGAGRVDISIMAAIGFDASAFGNHEFDAGTGAVAGIIGTDIRGAGLGDVRWLGSQFPYLSANLDFGGDVDLSGLFTAEILSSTDFQSTPDDLTAVATAPKIAPAAVVERGGQVIGIVGGTTPLLESISSPGDVTVKDPGAGTNDMDALAAILQPVIDDVIDGADDMPGTADDVNIIILTTHLQQLALEEALIGKLSGVDIVIAGGSDTLLADATDRLRPGDVAAGDYPLQTTNLDGDPALIVSTDGQYAYVGRLVVEFDSSGVVLPASLDPAVSGVFATDDTGVEALWATADPFAAGTKAALVRTLRDPLYDVIQAKDGNIFGITDVYLDGRRESVRTQETNLGDLTADANLAAARAVDGRVRVSIKNGGGIRAAIGQVIEVAPGEYVFGPPPANPAVGKKEGEISQLDVENTLRFNNLLTLLTLTADGLKQVLEHGVAATAPGQTPGQFPQVGGIAFSFDPAAPAGSRIQSAALIDGEGNQVETLVQNGIVAGDPNRPIRIVTLNFLAGGGDSYPFPALAADVVDTAIGEQTALADYLSANFATVPYNQEELPPGQDPRIQNLALRGDTVLAPAAANRLKLRALDQLPVPSAEIVAHDAVSQRLFVTGSGLDVIDFSDPSSLVIIGNYDIGDTTSVAVKNGIIAAAVPATPETDPGKVVFLDASGATLKEITVGALPDMLTFTPDGTKVLVANEGEPDGGIDPRGSVSIIDVSGGAANAALIATADFSAFDGQEDALRSQGVRIFPGKSVSEDVEPEYIAVAPDGSTALVTLQEANAVGILDLASNTFAAPVALGLKDHSAAGNGMDAGDRDDRINIRNWPGFGMYMPDAIAAYQANGMTYYITANEGDDRGEDERIADLPLDPTVFPDAAALQSDENLGRLGVSSIDGLNAAGTAFEMLYAYGARSFTIWSDAATRVYDSGDDFGRITANLTPALFNTDDGDPAEFDSRSDNKGAEPEGVITAVIADRTYAFVGLERAGGGVMIYDVTDPAAPVFDQYVRREGDISPEGLLFVDAPDGPEGKRYLVVANEVSSTLSVFEITVAGDLNGDGLVDASDRSIIRAAFGTASGEAGFVPAADYDNDGTITFNDYRQWYVFAKNANR